VGFHEADEVDPGDGPDGAGDEGFGGDPIECMLAQSGEAEDVADPGYAEEEETAIGRTGGDFDAAAADDQEMVGGKAFSDEDGPGFAMVADADGVEIAEDGTGERTRVLRTGRRSFCNTAREDSGPPGTQRKVACALSFYT
jgi:hypothetical protein